MVYARGVKSTGATRGGRNCLSFDNGLWPDTHNFSSSAHTRSTLPEPARTAGALLRGAESKANRKFVVKSQALIAWGCLVEPP